MRFAQTDRILLVAREVAGLLLAVAAIECVCTCTCIFCLVRHFAFQVRCDASVGIALNGCDRYRWNDHMQRRCGMSKCEVLVIS